MLVWITWWICCRYGTVMVCPTPWTSAWAPAWRGWWRWSSASTSGSSRTTPSPAGTTSCPPSSAPTILPRPSLPPPHSPTTVRCQTPGRGSPRWRRPPCPLTQDRQVLVQVTRDTAEIVSVRVRRRRASATTGRRTVLTPLRCTSPPVPNTNYIQVCHQKTRPTLRIFPILCHHFLFLLRAISNQQFLTSQRVFPGNLKVWLLSKILIFLSSEMQVWEVQIHHVLSWTRRVPIYNHQHFKCLVLAYQSVWIST